MDKAQALYSFWSGFGLPAYDASSVPTGDNAPDFPYITYFVATDSLGYPTALNASLWYRTSSWTAISQKAEEIAQAIVTMRKPISIEGGYVWLVKGQPFAQRMNDPTDDMIRRMYLNVTAEYLTAY